MAASATESSRDDSCCECKPAARCVNSGLPRPSPRDICQSTRNLQNQHAFGRRSHDWSLFKHLAVLSLGRIPSCHATSRPPGAAQRASHEFQGFLRGQDLLHRQTIKSLCAGAIFQRPAATKDLRRPPHPPLPLPSTL